MLRFPTLRGLQGSRHVARSSQHRKLKRMKTIVIILAIACVGLAGTLIYHRSTVHARITTVQTERDAATNQLASTATKLAEQEKLAGFLQTNLDQRSSELTVVSNDLVKTGITLASIQSELTAALASVKTAQSDVQTKGVRITQLETEKDEMSRKLGDLAGQINTLEGQITVTKNKLAASEGDRSFLTKELARLQNDKAELVRQFNDLAVLRAQVALLKEEAAISQRIAWMNQGVYSSAGRKGAEVLVAKPGQPVRPDPGLNVELEKNGGARVVPRTNAPQNQ